MSADDIQDIIWLYIFVAAIVSIVVALVLEKRLKARTPATRPYRWGYYFGCMGVACAPFVPIFALGVLATGSSGQWGQCGEFTFYMVYFAVQGACGWFIIRRKRWAWVVGTILSFNIVAWCINYIYARRRWGEFVGELYGSAGTEVEGYELLRDATKLERQGQIQKALSLYRRIADNYSHTNAGRDAKLSFEDLQAKTGATIQPDSNEAKPPPSDDNPTKYVVKQPNEAGEFSFTATLEEIKAGLKAGQIKPEWGVKKASDGYWITIHELINGPHRPRSVPAPMVKRTMKTKLIITALCAFILTGLFPPWQYTTNKDSVNGHQFVPPSQGVHSRKPAGYSLLFTPPVNPDGSPGNGVQIDFGRLFLEWALLAAMTGMAWILVVKPAWPRDDKADRPQKFIPPPCNPEN